MGMQGGRVRATIGQRQGEGRGTGERSSANLVTGFTMTIHIMTWATIFLVLRFSVIWAQNKCCQNTGETNRTHTLGLAWPGLRRAAPCGGMHSGMPSVHTTIVALECDADSNMALPAACHARAYTTTLPHYLHRDTTTSSTLFCTPQS